MVGRALLILRTVRQLKFVQVAYRLWYFALGRIGRIVPPHVGRGTPAYSGVRAAVPFPKYFRTWDGANGFTFLNETHELRTAEDWNRREIKKLWLYNLHYFDCLRQDGVQGEAALMARWVRENPPVKGNGWEPYPISLRVVNWIKWATAHPLSDEAAESLAMQVRWLMRRLEYHLLANHLLANAKALVFAGRFFKGPEAARWYAKGMAIYRHELPEQVLDDGVHFELSAMYHSIMLEDVLDCYNFTGETLFRTYGERMLAGLKLLTGPDGCIVKFNDAAEGIALTPDVLGRYARALSEKIEKSERFEKFERGERGRNSGYLRLEDGGYVLVAKCGAIGPDYQPGHAHADTYSFELWRGMEKIVTDTGTDRYVVDEERRRQRGTAAHNTVMIDGADSSEVWAGHRVGRRFDGRRHRRRFGLDAGGLRGHDELSGGGTHEVELSFHLPQGVAAEIEVRALGVAFERTEEPSPICEGFGRQSVGRCVRYRAQVKFPIAIDWKIR